MVMPDLLPTESQENLPKWYKNIKNGTLWNLLPISITINNNVQGIIMKKAKG